MYPTPRKPYSPPKRKKPLRKVGKATGTIRVYGSEKSALRDEVYLAANGFCQIRLPGCNGYTPFKDGHLAHRKSVGAGGSDTKENTVWSCPSCHYKSHNAGGKPCPPKPESAA